MQHVTFEPPLTLATAYGSTGTYPLSVRVFDWQSDREALYRLRYRAYRASGWLPENSNGRYHDAYDDLPTTVNLGVYDGRHYVGALRLCFSLDEATGETLPCAPHYPEIAQVRQCHRGPIVEISRLAVEPRLDKLAFKTTIYGTLVRAGCLVYEAAGATYVLVATHQRLQTFYKRMLGFAPLAGPAPYPPGNAPIVMLGADIAKARQQRQGRNAFFSFSSEEIAEMKRVVTPLFGHQFGC